ncbi:IS5-like element ISSpal2 family transposase [Sphingopyxis alaskensis]|uniref:Transposase, IS4 family n=1 Tax=Sphingopyxis alaskensis (strain DSM 13593 / LMG 18877 / RB2256) TaxID=317655 RepID=Q1GRA8_SPHAL|nr:IS5-like element ISSpal2 family transposase [Sphingopyxis alaskensis]ABF53814.1 transposase, IS4 family [Sphingopyxis alaskensis RB2256]
MRGDDIGTERLFSYVSCEARVSASHPLRPIRAIVDEVLEVLPADFEGMYAKTGRPSIAPGKLLRALLLQAFYSIRSERQLMEQMDYNLLFRRFVGLSMDAAVWDASVFTKNRDRLLEGDVATRFLAAVVAQARGRDLLSDEHFSVDGTLIDAWASMKSFRPRDDGEGPAGAGRNAERDFRGEKRSNQTHASTTDPEAKLYRKANGQSSRMAFMGHGLMENRNGLVVGALVTQATGTAEREAALVLVDELKATGRITLGADKAYDARAFVQALRARKVTPHIARNEQINQAGERRRRSAIDGRTTRHPGYAISLAVRKRIEEVFGWARTVGGPRKTRHKGTDRVGQAFTLTAATCNLVRLPKPMVAA